MWGVLCRVLGILSSCVILNNVRTLEQVRERKRYFCHQVCFYLVSLQRNRVNVGFPCASQLFVGLALVLVCWCHWFSL